MSDFAIRLEHIAHTYEAGTPLAVPALADASLAVRRGEIMALVGASGAGKSTLVAFANGLLRPVQRGHAEVLGLDTADPSADLRSLRARVGLVMQYPHQQMFERLVGDDVAYGPRQLGLAGDALRERVRWAMGAVGLGFDAFVDRRTFSLSGGEMRRAALAGVLAMKPEVLVLDEATAGIDPAGRARVHDLLRRLRSEEGTTVVLVSNEMDEVAALADSVTVLDRGRTVQTGSPREVLVHAQALYDLGLAVPEPTRIAQALAERGLPVARDLLTEAEVEGALWPLLKG